MYISIDFNSDEALYLQLRNQIVYAIVKAELREGGKSSPPSVIWQRRLGLICTR